MSLDDAARFDAVVRKAVAATVVAGSTYDPRRRKNNVVLATERTPEALLELQEALQIEPDGEAYYWMTPGEPTIALFDQEGELLLTVTGILPRFIRTPLLDGDMPLASPDRLPAWLADRGWPRQESVSPG